MSDADPANGAGTIDVSSRQLFIDDRFIAEARDVALTMNPPTRHDEPCWLATVRASHWEFAIAPP